MARPSTPNSSPADLSLHPKTDSSASGAVCRPCSAVFGVPWGRKRAFEKPILSTKSTRAWRSNCTTRRPINWSRVCCPARSSWPSVWRCRKARMSNAACYCAIATGSSARPRTRWQCARRCGGVTCLACLSSRPRGTSCVGWNPYWPRAACCQRRHTPWPMSAPRWGWWLLGSASQWCRPTVAHCRAPEGWFSALWSHRHSSAMCRSIRRPGAA